MLKNDYTHLKKKSIQDPKAEGMHTAVLPAHLSAPAIAHPLPKPDKWQPAVSQFVTQVHP